MTYSSALFQSLEESLEQAQFNKIDRMLDLADVGETPFSNRFGWGRSHSVPRDVAAA